MKPSVVPATELKGVVVGDGDIKGSNSKETAARINPAQKFWKHASIRGGTFRFISAKDARSIDMVGIDPIRILNRTSSRLSSLAIVPRCASSKQ